MRNVVDQFTRMAELVPSIPGELISSALNMEDPLQLVYAIATYVRIELDEAQNLLEIDSLEGKLPPPDGPAGQGTGGAGAGPQDPDRGAIRHGEGAARNIFCANS